MELTYAVDLISVASCVFVPFFHLPRCFADNDNHRLHISDFKSATGRFWRIKMLIIKGVPYLTQLLWCLMFFGECYLLLNNFGLSSACVRFLDIIS